VVVAARYGASQYLIGPSLYPYFVATLTTLATIGLPLVVIAAVVSGLSAANPVQGAMRAIGTSINAAWVVFGIVTLIFWQMERITPRPNLDDDWDPTHLPALPVEGPREVSRAQSLSHVVFLGVYLLWWIDLLPLPQWLYTSTWAGQFIPRLAPVWQDVWLAIALLMAAQLVMHLLNFWQPQMPKWRLVVHVLCDVAALGIIYYLVQADMLVVAAEGARWANELDKINNAVKIGLIVLAVLIALGLVFDEGRRLLGKAVATPFNPAHTARLAAVKASGAARVARRFHR
jgi:hypothetical protein